MRRLTLIFSCLLIAYLSVAQTAAAYNDSSNAAVTFLKNWEKDFLEVGVSIQGDSVHLNEEAKRLFLDSAYRQSMYPVKYNWPVAVELMNKMELKKAFWHIINLYRTDTVHRDLALQTFILYDSLVDMEKILSNTFYTYALTDPEICIFKNGKPQITRPDILEGKFNQLKQITGYILEYRSRKKLVKTTNTQASANK